jgi:hypothetical protein
MQVANFSMVEEREKEGQAGGGPEGAGASVTVSLDKGAVDEVLNQICPDQVRAVSPGRLMCSAHMSQQRARHCQGQQQKACHNAC